MRKSLMLLGLVAAGWLAVSRAQPEKLTPGEPAPGQTPAAAQETRPPSKVDRSADEAAIRANVAAFVRAYNTQDARALASLFAQDALIIDKGGNTHQGRQAIEQVFAGLFKAAPQKRQEVSVEDVRFLGPDLAVEVGSTREVPAPGEAAEYDRYTVLHVKRDGKWLMALARDSEGVGPTSREQLQELAWLIGEWVDDGGSVVVNSSCRWSEDGHFLLQDFNLRIEGQEAMKVTQRIGWDPLGKHIRSWVFDSEGGFGEGAWYRTGDAWIIKVSAVRPDGSTASATNLLKPTGPDGYVWRSTDRIVANEVTPSIEVRVVRKPPQPRRQASPGTGSTK